MAYGGVEADRDTGAVVALQTFRRFPEQQAWLRESPPGRVRVPRAAKTVRILMRRRELGRELAPLGHEELAVALFREEFRKPSR
jgi:hypothetical protein